jgi:5-methyltetrahydropteroyltriglutamate--homocysteine methyltransferase
MKRSTSGILTTHSGSLPRPPELIAMLTNRADGQPVPATKFDSLVCTSVKQVVQKQVAAGLSIVNDGEHSKISYSGYLKDRLSGFEELEEGQVVHRLGFAEAADFPEYYERVLGRGFRRAYCVGPVGWKDFSEVERDIANLTAAVYGLNPSVEDVFLSAASPSVAASFQPNRYYRTEEEYRVALADALKREYRAIVDAGFVLQVDMPAGVASRRFGAESTRDEVRWAISQQIEILNYALADIPADRSRIHMCWGSDEAPHHRDVELPVIVDLLLQAKPDGITMVGANGRHAWEWQIWQDVKLPPGKVLIAGVIDSTTNIVEHPETVADRIVRYASAVGRENVIAGVDCGFSTAAGTEDYRVDPRVAWAKLGSLVAGARLATERLWG